MELAIFVLATWRLASLFATEEGPYNLFGRIRKWSGMEYDEHSLPQGRNEFAKMLMCVWCNSLWIGISFTLLRLVWSDAVWVAVPLALSAGAIIIERIVQEAP